MIYTVSGGTLNPTHSLTHLLVLWFASPILPLILTVGLVDHRTNEYRAATIFSMHSILFAAFWYSKGYIYICILALSLCVE